MVMLLIALTDACRAQQSDDDWTGSSVVVITAGAELKAGEEVITKLPFAAVVKVTAVRGNWLWIKNEKGWLRKKDAVLAKKAEDYFTALIQKDPTAEAYRRRGVVRVAIGKVANATIDFNLALKIEPGNATALNDRGNAYRKLGKLDRAITDFTEIISSGVSHPAVYTNRGMAYFDSKDFDKALADFSEAISIESKFAPAYEARGSYWRAVGRYENATKDFSEAIQVDSNFILAKNNLAWLLATCPLEEFRDGPKAVTYAKEVCDATAYQDADFLDTLAAAYAEAGEFENAVKYASEAVKLKERNSDPITSRLELYRAGKPFREQPPWDSP